MPGTILPVSFTVSKNLIVVQHDTAEDFLSAACATLWRHEQSSNIILAHALQRARSESALVDRDMTAYTGLHLKSSSSIPHRTDSFWLTVWSSTSLSTPATLDLALSCISSTLGNYPIFLWTPHHQSTVSFTWLTSRIIELARHLHVCIPPERVFSVFGKAFLVKAFGRHWVELTGTLLEPEPFYAAYHTFCTPKSLRDSDHQIPTNQCIRQATIHDLDDVARLCQEFADSSIFFPLGIEKARIEAEEMIFQHKIWVYEVTGEIASICAVGRDSPKVAAVTKVYTTPTWRRNGFAEHLLRHVTRSLFTSGKDSVVLYVAYHSGALRVYGKVGFVGLIDQEKPSGVEDVLELGFVDADRGHW